MTRARWTLVAVGALIPVAIAIILLTALVLEVPRLGAAIALGVLFLAFAVACGVVLWARRRYRRVRAILDGESIDLDQPSVGVRAGGAVASAWPRAARIVGGQALGLPADAVAGFGMATRSPFALDQLAGMATGWRLGAREIAQLFRATEDPVPIRLALGRVDGSALLLLARTMASGFPDHADVADAIARYAARTSIGASLPMSLRHWLIERLVVAGDLEQAAALIGTPSTTHGQLVAIDILNPFTRGALLSAPGAWQAALAGVFSRAGLEGVSLTDGDGVPFDRLRAEPTAHLPRGGTLVSILMTVYRPDAAALETAVASVLGQSYPDWELILIDDGSPAEFDTVLADAAASDPRIRLVRADENAGTYIRRNEAIITARGTYVTMHDSDDWMHPRRLETQVRHLDGHPELLANLCRSARVTPELRFVQPRGTLLRLTEASLLFRREETVERVGYFDSLRKGADTGFRLRIEAVTGRPVPIVEVEAPLVLSRYDDASLSGSDLRDGWTHPARVAYSSAHAAWLAAQRSAGRPPIIDFPLADRPFPAPPELRGEGASPVEVDVVFVADVRDDPARARHHRADENDIRAAAAAGLRVGLRRLDGVARSGIPPSARRAVQDMVNAGTVIELLPGWDVRARTVVVLEELVLLGAPPEESGLAADAVLVVEDETPLRAECRSGIARLIPAADVRFVSRVEARRAVGLLAR